MKRIGFYPRLAAQSMGKNRALYLPYLLMSALMVAVFYIMCYMCTPGTIGAMGAGETTLIVMNLGMMVVGVFAAIFLYYCNTFLVGRRMKEFGLYNVLGMGKRNIARIMIWETLLVMLLALAGGLVGGISLARAAELLMIRILDAKLTTGISVSPMGVLRTVQVFAGIYLVILLVNLLRMRLSNPMALLRSESAGEKPPRANWIMAALGAALLGFGYYLAVTVDDPITAIFFFFLAVLVVIGGTYLLFMAGSVTMCRVLQKNKRYYYKTNHFISLSSMAFRMKRNGAGLATICILCTMVLVILSSTLCLYTGIEDLVRITYPREMTVSLERHGGYEITDADEAALTDSIRSMVEAEGDSFENLQSLRAYSTNGHIHGGSFASESDMNHATTKVTELYIYPLSKYEALTGEAVTLREGELLAHTLKGNFRGDSLSIFGGDSYALKHVDTVPELFAAPCYRVIFDCVLLFAEDFEGIRAAMQDQADPDEIYQRNNVYLYFDTSAEGEAIIDLQNRMWPVVWDTVERQFAREGGFSLDIKNVHTAREEFYGMFGGLFFIGLILGGVFSLAAVLIIYYKQISEGYEDAGRFALMRKVGLDDSEIHRSINSQVLTVFFAPLMMAGLHVLFAMPMVKLVLRSFGMHNASLFYSVTGMCFIAFALIYAAVYFITSRTYYRIVR